MGKTHKPGSDTRAEIEEMIVMDVGKRQAVGLEPGW